MTDKTTQPTETSTPGSAGEVFLAFLPLGFTAFGGPVAHLGYFRTAFVERKRWMSDGAYADLVALCQFLPGPASSQVGMAIGLQRAGGLGMAAAFLAFTLPSAMLMAAFGLFVSGAGFSADEPWLLGLKAAAVAVVAHALLGMAGSLAATREKATIAAAAAVLVLLAPDRTLAQLAAIVLGGICGLALGEQTPQKDDDPTGARPVGRIVGIGALVLFVALLTLLPLAAALTPGLDLFDRIYRAGALVFGGGHVVLPLLETEMTGMVDRPEFLAGYGAAQVVPGPLFTFASYLGAVAEPFGGVPGAIVATFAIFLPGALLLVGVMPFWQEVRQVKLARSVLAGVNAAVVGILAAAFYDPVFTSGVTSAEALAIAIAAYIALKSWSAPPALVVVACGALGWVLL